MNPDLKPNVGGLDRAVRMAAGVVLVLAAIFAPAGAVWRILALIIGVAALATATLRYCPVNAVLGINSHKPPGFD